MGKAIGPTRKDRTGKTSPGTVPGGSLEHLLGQLDPEQRRQGRQGVLHVHGQGRGGLLLPRRGPGALHGGLGGRNSTMINA